MQACETLQIKRADQICFDTALYMIKYSFIQLYFSDRNSFVFTTVAKYAFRAAKKAL